MSASLDGRAVLQFITAARSAGCTRFVVFLPGDPTTIEHDGTDASIAAAIRCADEVCCQCYGASDVLPGRKFLAGFIFAFNGDGMPIADYSDNAWSRPVANAGTIEGGA